MRNNSGNVLFLILIAVALFAALSFAVTQSSRSGGSSTVKETATINSSVLSQYTASVRTSLLRMTTDNHNLLDLEFNMPADFNDLTSQAVGVFHPNGGGVIYERAPAALLNIAANPTGQWIFTLNFEVNAIGTSVASSNDGNDLMALLPGVTKDVCTQVNARLGIATTPFPTESGAAYSSQMLSNLNGYYMDHDYVQPTTEIIIGAGATDSALSGKAEGCYYEDTAKQYVYYSVLLDR